MLFSQGVCRAAVPVFFLISGYLFFIRLDDWDYSVWKDKIRKRVKTLVVPYLLWNIIAFVAFYIVQCIKSHVVTSLINCFLNEGGFRIFWDSHSDWMPINFPLWFIRDLIVIVLFTPVIWKLIEQRTVGIMVMGLMTALHVTCIWPFTNGLSSTALLFFTAGAYLQVHKKDLLVFFKRVEISSYIASLLLLFLIVYCWGRYDINQYLHHVLQIVITIAAFNIANCLSGSNIEQIGRKYSSTAFWIFAIQSIYVIDVCKVVMAHVVSWQTPIGGILRYFGCFIMATIICMVSYFLLKKCIPKTINFLCGSR